MCGRELDGVGSRGAGELDGVGAERLDLRDMCAVLAYFRRSVFLLRCAAVLPGLS